jgi:hypothetical protein
MCCSTGLPDTRKLLNRWACSRDNQGANAWHNPGNFAIFYADKPAENVILLLLEGRAPIEIGDSRRFTLT